MTDATQQALIDELRADEIDQVTGGAGLIVSLDPNGDPGQFFRPPLPPNIPVIPFLPKRT